MGKVEYFTETTIDENAKSMYRKLDSKFDLHKNRIEIQKSALLILDMQDFFHNEKSHAFIPSAKAIIKPIKSLANLFISNKLPVIITKHINTKANAKQMDTWWRDILMKDNNYSQLIAEFDIPQTELIVKSQYDAFYETNLNDILQKNNIEQVIITGVMTHLCCETTARSAFVRGYNVFFPIDGTATYNEEFHNATLTNLAHGFANITLIENLIHSFNGK
ncbi:MAG: isochorismatase family protein [Candidatus Marinimicrobia bacterium]|nr:isochorismatase family protein [Candidatus Neomarinimicrobiota bacterium]